MNKRYLLFFIAILALVVLAGCSLPDKHCEHKWINIDCNTPKTCSLCKATEGDPIGHSWISATCKKPKYCFRCQITEGETLDHDWREATCRKAKYCFNCRITEGNPLEHIWTEATCKTKRTCTLCKKTEGDTIPHNYVKNVCTVCGEKLASTYNDLVRYLNDNYDKLETPLGTITDITFEIQDNNPPIHSPCDYELRIVTSLYIKDKKHSVASLLSSDYYPYEDRVKTLTAVIEYAHEVSELAINAFPDKKMKGCFFDSGYDYPNFKVGYWNVQYLTFLNYDGPGMGSYSSTTLSHWRINEILGDGISDHFGVPNALKEDVKSRLSYDITFKKGYF